MFVDDAGRFVSSDKSEIEAQLTVAQEIIAAAVVRGDAILADGLAVFLRGIAFVGAPVVLGVFFGETVHVVVTVGLGEDRGSGDGEVLAVAFDDSGMGDVGGNITNHGTVGTKAVTVDDDGLRTDGELIEGTVHGEDGGIEDIDLVNLLRRDDAHGPRYRIALDDLTQLITALLRQLL